MRDILLTVLAEHQPDLNAHSSGVSHLALKIGRLLGMHDRELDDIARAADLHDVGKVAIPREMLDKPGPLSSDEWRFMRRHTEIGERILNSAPAFRGVARLVRSSHERWDGSGYPDGLAGDEIPLGSRIIAVCDAYDAMTGDRPYQVGRTSAEALAELRRGAGTQFDPLVTAAFCSHIEGDTVDEALDDQFTISELLTDELSIQPPVNE
jgi:HD-GYP domain-containing protein (c-di-GMP phosphodiesterase class II)